MNLYHVTKFSPYFPFTLYCFYTKISSFMPALTIGIVPDCFYMLIFCSEKFSMNLSLTLIGSLSNDVFERRTSTGSEAFSLFICLDANKFVLLSFFSLIKTIYQRVSTKPLPNDAKSPLPVDVRRSKTPLLKLPNLNICNN